MKNQNVTEFSWSKNEVKILQISDIHLFATQSQSLLGICCWNSFQAVLEQIKNDKQDFDFIVISGDISQDDSPESYKLFVSAIEQNFNKPVFWIAGNHDVSELLAEHLNQKPFENSKKIITPNWQILLLNSQVVGAAHGKLADEEMHFVAESLALNPNLATLIFVHHNSIPVGCEWLDQHCMKNGAEFLSLLSKHQNVKAVICGHVHQEIEQNHEGIKIISTPSTCIQFKPNCKEFTLDELQPAYRYINLTATGNFVTEVKRLKGKEFLPNMQAQGY